ncbi:Rid family hydrolase [Virgibacillus sp. C22-A2]|uniref:Rid family hydrolase n=1 Tax=Virgibacillus tibetensis TaxID=3042313 RepID=A0ABU6KE09_9BACI|nr:Rid family hydrolase [Virgibacillus sp. C22-A2]
MKQAIETIHAPQPSGPYSQGVKVGQFIFVSGQDGVHPDGKLAGETIADQAAASLENIKNILAETGADLSNIVHVTCHLSELNQNTVQEFNKVYASYFEHVAVKPARITIGSQLLGVKVEITAVAAIN